MSDKPLLYYFDGRGYGEITRIAFCLGGIEFDQKYLRTRDEFLDRCNDGTFRFRCVPYMKWGDFELSQSGAIVRYVAKKTGLMGKDDEEAARIDMMYEATRDLWKFYLFFGFMDEDALIKEAKDNGLRKFLPIFEKILQESGTGYLVGNEPTLADAGLLECLLYTIDFIGDEILHDYKQIQKFLVTMKSLPQVEHYLKNIRKVPNTPDSVSQIRAVLNWNEQNQPKKD